MQVYNVTSGITNTRQLVRKSETSFSGCNKNNCGQQYNAAQKFAIGAMSALGVAASMAILSKCRGYSLNPKKITSIKDTYFMKAKFEEADIIAMGAGSCIGGLTGGCLLDKNKTNRKLKKREAVMQIGNVSIPVLTVGAFSRLGKKFGKIPQACGAIAGLFTGVFLSNIIMNRLSDAIFKTNKTRKVKLSDFSAHIDDMLMAASFVSDAPVIQKLSRVIPFALIVPGYETGKQQAD